MGGEEESRERWLPVLVISLALHRPLHTLYAEAPRRPSPTEVVTASNWWSSRTDFCSRRQEGIRHLIPPSLINAATVLPDAVHYVHLHGDTAWSAAQFPTTIVCQLLGATCRCWCLRVTGGRREGWGSTLDEACDVISNDIVARGLPGRSGEGGILYTRGRAMKLGSISRAMACGTLTLLVLAYGVSAQRASTAHMISLTTVEFKGSTTTEQLAPPASNPADLSKGYGYKAPGQVDKHAPQR
jgi:hypothetical protein